MISMKRVRRTSMLAMGVSGLLGLAGLWACGGPPQPTTVAGAGAPSASSAKKPSVGVAGEDRSAVELPKGVAVQVHAGAPRAIVKAVKGYLPAVIAAKIEARAMVADMIDAPALAQLVDIDQPIDAVLAVTESEKDPVASAYAFGIEDDADLEAALKADFKLDPVPGGAFKVIPLRHANYDDPGLGHYYHDCAILPSLGPTKRRLVCSPDANKFHDIDYLAPWLARGVTAKAAPASDLTIAVDAATLRTRFASELKKGHDTIRGYAAGPFGIGKAQLDKVVGKLAQQIVDEAFAVVDDVDALNMNVSFPADGARATLSIAFGHADSWTAKAFLSGADVDGPAPALFGKLPSSGAWLAEFARASSTSDALIQPFQQGLLQLVEATAIDFVWPQKDKDAALELVRLMFPRAADTVVLAGNPGASADAPATVPALYGPIGAMIGVAARPSWTISASDRDAKNDLELAKAFAALLVRPSFASTLSKLTDDKISLKVTSKTLSPKALPKGAIDQGLDITVSALDAVTEEVSGKPVKGKMKVVTHFTTEQIVIPEGTTRSWVGWAQNGADGDLLTRMTLAMSPSPPAPLSASPGYDFLTKQNASSGAIMTVDGMVRGFAPKAKEATDALADLPDGGKGSLAVRSSATRAASGGTTEIAMALPRDFLVLISELARNRKGF